jgi:hypothetical protein
MAGRRLSNPALEVSMRTPLIALAIGLVASGHALAHEPIPETPTEAPAEASAPPSCVSPRDIQSTTPISDREIVFRMRNGKIWKNTLSANCPGLKFEGGFSWTIRGDTVCANLQTIEVLRRGNACLLGEFSAYTPPAPDAD